MLSEDTLAYHHVPVRLCTDEIGGILALRQIDKRDITAYFPNAPIRLKSIRIRITDIVVGFADILTLRQRTFLTLSLVVLFSHREKFLPVLRFPNPWEIPQIRIFGKLLCHGAKSISIPGQSFFKTAPDKIAILLPLDVENGDFSSYSL